MTSDSVGSRLDRWQHTARTWGSDEDERRLEYACDRYLANPRDVYFRGIDVSAPPEVTFRWLCQLKAAPYSYDWLDNFGRRSPPELIPGLEQLRVGDRFMTIFDLVEFEPNRHITLEVRRLTALFGPAAVTYLVRASGPASSRLLVKLVLGGRARPNPIGWAQRNLMPSLELFMMRKQLLTLKQLAEAGS